MAFHVSIRLNTQPAMTPTVRRVLADPLEGTGIRVSDEIPGLLIGDHVSLESLGSLLTRLGELASDPELAMRLPASGGIDDLWVHITRAKP
jgi:hypothetical protein